MSFFEDFLLKFMESFKGTKPVIHSVLGNVFSMRVIGNKTHGDLAEIALTEYINESLIKLVSKILVSPREKHEKILDLLRQLNGNS